MFQLLPSPVLHANSLGNFVDGPLDDDGVATLPTEIPGVDDDADAAAATTTAVGAAEAAGNAAADGTVTTAATTANLGRFYLRLVQHPQLQVCTRIGCTLGLPLITTFKDITAHVQGFHHQPFGDASRSAIQALLAKLNLVPHKDVPVDQDQLPVPSAQLGDSLVRLVAQFCQETPPSAETIAFNRKGFAILEDNPTGWTRRAELTRSALVKRLERARKIHLLARCFGEQALASEALTMRLIDRTTFKSFSVLLQEAAPSATEAKGASAHLITAIPSTR